MISFEHPLFFIFILVGASIALLLLWYLRWRSSKMALLASPANLDRQLFVENNKRFWQRWSLFLLSILFIVIAGMNLRIGSGTEKVDRNGVDVMIALDVSNSMLAQDMSPDRLERSKTLIRQVLSQLQNDRVGLLLFAGRAYLQSPLTADHNAVKMLLNAAHPNVIQSQGTNISEAIALSMKSFNRADKKYKTLVIISDGEDHEPAAVQAAKEARNEGVVIHTIGVGSAAGAGFTDPKTGMAKVDNEGNPVVTRLNEAALTEISKAGDGTYQLLFNTGKVAATLVSNINNMEKRNQGAVVFTDYKSYYKWFLIPGLLLLIIFFIMPSSHKSSKYAV